jgi:hypothetical protein
VTYSQDGKKGNWKMNIDIVVSLEPSSRCAYKIVKRHTIGSMVVLTEVASVTKAGMNYIPDQFWKETLGINGVRAIVENMVNGNKKQVKELEERNLLKRVNEYTAVSAGAFMAFV